MTITYDPAAKRATHVETGLAVEFLRYGFHAQEQDVYFKLIWDGREHEFEASWDAGYHKIKEAHPDLSIGERAKKRYELNERNFHVGIIGGVNVHEIMTRVPEFPQAFVEAWQKTAAEETKNRRVSVYFTPFSTLDEQWSVEG